MRQGKEASPGRVLTIRGSKGLRQLGHQLLGLLPLAQVFQRQLGHQDRNLSLDESVHKL